MSLSITRKKTRRIMVGDVAVGGGAPISVQSMTNTKTDDVDATVQQIRRLTEAGCEIVRVAVPDESAAQAISQIKPAIDIPLVADIHFDYRLAIASARNGADGLRFNPGNIGSHKNIRALVDCARDCRIPIRIGVNAGSLEKDILEKHQGVTAKAMVESALRHAALLQDLDFHDIKISIKASDVPRTLEAYRMLSRRTDLPLHVGVTEAGALYSGIVKSALGIGTLLAEGIGDTLRVSLTRDPVEEVRVGFEILRALDIRHRGPEIVSCPTCGRCDIPLFEIVDAVEKALMTRTTPVKLAIMGCVVNGPGEAREADIGVAGGNGVGILFKKGKVVKKFPQDRLVDVVLDAVDEFERQNKSR
ncbi:4-hydroxy-3-methylbut-2-en-1-yl diphosphate synthase (flavodoxin) [Desulfosarcina widdelii]|uniref:4-hydroxy-3-methylbut-2-en-1-yl diphosphate synthase (flavodoxin) n=1 Tax=Desulfosarcina widdelii TaxID=947919 RepID=A0A5K7Z9R6_9BACT|nr:flavodoxin-dependent (E)-4-hydroxy-3-methylbut-2-enyl-diphosphate synthase [Desulfosarcina widdelii]BBO76431.1 4-hydroxy-3-methylbut-2-en-1-yl diphosphate synthase (flavodoxin) [Desulfosarcina widdelii]